MDDGGDDRNPRVRFHCVPFNRTPTTRLDSGVVPRIQTLARLAGPRQSSLIFPDTTVNRRNVSKLRKSLIDIDS